MTPKSTTRDIHANVSHLPSFTWKKSALSAISIPAITRTRFAIDHVPLSAGGSLDGSVCGAAVIVTAGSVFVFVTVCVVVTLAAGAVTVFVAISVFVVVISVAGRVTVAVANAVTVSVCVAGVTVVVTV